MSQPETQNGMVPEEAARVEKKVKKSLKHPRDVSLSKAENGDVSEEKGQAGKVKKSVKLSGVSSLPEAQNGNEPKETGNVKKVKKSQKHPLNASLSEAQNGDEPEETVKNVKVQKSLQTSTSLTNGEATTDLASKQKKKKKRKMVNDAGPGKSFSLDFRQFLTVTIHCPVITGFI